MELGEHSKNRIKNSLHHWRVCKDFADPMYNYLVYGFEPGSFFVGWYANDASSIIRSHPANTVESLKDLTKWMLNCMPREAKGSHENVRKWLSMKDADRRKVLEDWKLVYSEHDELMLILSNVQTSAPAFW
jgi:hypothetical protein